MKILCVIDSFGSGGAQRQLVNLACGLKGRGHEVHAFVYYPHQNFFRGELDRFNIPVHSVEKKGKLGLNVLTALVALLRTEGFDVLVSFLDTPNVYSALAKLISPKLKLIVSERSSYHHDKNRFLAFLKRALYIFSDSVVTNSLTQAGWLRRYPWLTRRVVTIYNGFPLPSAPASSQVMPSVKFLVIGRIGPEKNGLRLVEALELFRAKNGYVPEISWVGKEDVLPAGQRYVRSLKALIDAHPLVSAKWNWLGECRNVMELLAEHRALIHPSLYEGLPNVVCEAFIAGRPVLASDVCDHGYLIGDEERGLLFDPYSPHSIMETLDRAASWTTDAWKLHCKNAWGYASTNLVVSRMVDQYESLMSNK